MPRAIPDALRIFKTKRSRDLTLLYAALLLLSVHWAIVIYINSSFLGQFVPGTFIGLLYGVGSLLSLLLFFHTPSLLHTIGNYKLTIYFATLEILAVVGMALAQTTPFAIFFFLLHFILMPMLLFNLDIFIEEVIGKDEKKTGSKRGLYLCLLSLATAVGPLLTGFLSTGNNSSLASAYVLSSVFLLPFLFIICAYFKNFENPEYSPLSLSSMTHRFWDIHMCIQANNCTPREGWYVIAPILAIMMWFVALLGIYGTISTWWQSFRPLRKYYKQIGLGELIDLPRLP